MKKKDFPVEEVRHYLEPGPVVLVSSAHAGERNVMTLGWQTVMEFTPSLVGCMIAGGNHSFGLIRKSRECVINLPTAELLNTVIGIGNCSGADTDKFEKFGLTPRPARHVGAPLIEECVANFECRLHDGAMIDKYNFFIFEVVKAHVTGTRHPETIHYTGNGIFRLAGPAVNRRSRFRPEMV